MRFSTKAIHSGQMPDKTTGAVVVPVYQTSTYQQEEINVHKGFEYSRTGNPTRQALEECLADIENGRFALAFSSGMAAENTILSTMKPGDHVIVAEDMYAGTNRLFEQVFKPYGIQFSYVKGKPVDFEKAIRHGTKLFWIESPTNPILSIIDISGVSSIARKNNIRLVVDNTFASPFFQQPLLLGADLVVHSTTKYISGHSDLIGGAIIVNDEEWYAELKFLQNAVGAIPGPFDCWLTLRGLKTLSVRMNQHEKNASRIAAFLENHKKITRVYYPGLASDPFHSLAKQQMTGFGGMISFKLREGDEEAANSFFKKLKIISLAESLGGVESLICYPYTMTHGSIPEKERIAIGVTKDLIRLSAGIEDVEDLIEDLERALK